MPNEIKFYGINDAYGCFSNFSRHEVVYENHVYPTSEHAFQAAKTFDPAERAAIAMLKTPGEAKRAGRKLNLRPDWEDVRFSVMVEILYSKALSHKDFRETLESTKDAIIIENSPTDYVWGCGADGSGQNLLGKALMKVRNELRWN